MSLHLGTLSTIQENRVLPTLVKGDAKFTHTHLPHIDISHSAESNLKSDSKREYPLNTSETLELTEAKRYTTPL